MKKKKNTTNIILVIIIIIGLSLLLYPTLSDYWNSFHQSHVIATYVDEVENMDKNTYQELWEDALEYNQNLVLHPNNYVLTENQRERYESVLNIGNSGVMGYVEIPNIDVSLPIYHGTNESVLQTSIGHLEWTSLPVGGNSSHCVLSGHRGLPSAKLFSNLDQLVEGDIFVLKVLDQVLTYEVDQILIVEPQDIEALKLVEDKDYCTLVTCTPYGINTHRLLVRGHRIENVENAYSVHVTMDAIQIEPLLVAPILAIPLLFILLIGLLIQDKRKGKIE